MAVFGIAVLTLLCMGDFKVPGPKEQTQAIGDTRGLPEALRRALDPGEDFDAIPRPGDSDWLAVHPEEGQTFEQFVKASRNVPGGGRKKIYLQPLGEFAAESSPPLESLKEFAAAFFNLDVEVLETREIRERDFAPRTNQYTGKRQILTGDVLDFLRTKLPRDAFCLLGITLEDLYPDPSWNFVFGQASLRGRTGIYSFARYDPAFYGGKRGEGVAKLVLRRSLKVLAHETAHMFGLLHCIHFSCLMNGSNHLEEADARPAHLCPVCLRKLQLSVSFDVVERYGRLREFYEKVGFGSEARWIEKRLEWIAGGEPRKETKKEKGRETDRPK